MNRTLLLLSFCVTCATSACDLAELNPGTEAGSGTDGAGRAGMDSGSDASGDLSAVSSTDMPPNIVTDMSGNLAGDMAMTAAADMGDDTGIPAGAMIGSCDPARWAAGATDSHPVNPPSYAIDGLAPTRWSTGTPQLAGQYFQIDFGGFVTINQIVLDHAFATDGKDDYPRGLDVLVSYDGVDYSRKLQSVANMVDPGVMTIDFPAHAARYLRLSLNQGAGISWWTIHELRVGCRTPGDAGAGPATDGGAFADYDGGLPDGGVNPNRAAWMATASSTNGGDWVTNAFDGNPNTRWADGKTPQYGDEWYRLDMGKPYGISQVWLSAAGGDYPSAYELSLSTDDMTYTPVARGLGVDMTRIVFAKQSARYVRIKQIGSGYDHWWSINELTVLP